MSERKRRKFTAEQKAEAVRLVYEVGSIGQVARDLDLTESALRNWVKPRRSLQKRPVAVTSKPASKISADALDLALISFLRQVTSQFCAPALGSALQHVGMMQQPIEHGSDGSVVAEEFSPVFDRAV